MASIFELKLETTLTDRLREPKVDPGTFYPSAFNYVRSRSINGLVLVFIQVPSASGMTLWLPKLGTLTGLVGPNDYMLSLFCIIRLWRFDDFWPELAADALDTPCAVCERKRP